MITFSQFMLGLTFLVANVYGAAGNKKAMITYWVIFIACWLVMIGNRAAGIQQ